MQRTSVGDFSGYLEEIVVPDVSVLSMAIVLRHFGELAVARTVVDDGSCGKTDSLKFGAGKNTRAT